MMLLSAVVFASQASAQGQPTSGGLDFPLFITVLPAPTNVDPFRGDDQAHVAYELFVSNFTIYQVPVAITSLEITGMANGQETFTKKIKDQDESKDLTDIFSSIAGDPTSPQEPLLQPGQRTRWR
jgi:hypothetical protein